MILSMTAFSRGQSQGEWGNLICEIRSINHRFIEIGVHLPEILRPLEMQVREVVRKYLKRGKIELNLRYQASSNQQGLITLNTSLAKEVISACEVLTSLLANPAPIQPTDLLRFPGIIETQQTNFQILETQVLPLVTATIKDLMSARRREGQELAQTLLVRVDAIDLELNKIAEQYPHTLEELQNKLTKRFLDAKIELDPNRLEQEMLIFAQKLDIAEEIERTKTHLKEMRRVLLEGGSVGRRLDFLLQELNRETNTIGSKSIDAHITHLAVEIKVLIEQIREQVQNIE